MPEYTENSLLPSKVNYPDESQAPQGDVLYERLFDKQGVSYKGAHSSGGGGSSGSTKVYARSFSFNSTPTAISFPSSGQLTVDVTTPVQSPNDLDLVNLTDSSGGGGSSGDTFTLTAGYAYRLFADLDIQYKGFTTPTADTDEADFNYFWGLANQIPPNPLGTGGSTDGVSTKGIGSLYAYAKTPPTDLFFFPTKGSSSEAYILVPEAEGNKEIRLFYDATQSGTFPVNLTINENSVCTIQMIQPLSS